MSVIRTENLNYVYSQGTPFKKAAITDVNINIEKGDFIGIIGHTGSGKSTLVQHFNGLLKPTSGKVYFNEEDVLSDPKKLRELRFKVGLVFQYPEYQLFDETVESDIGFGPKNMGLSDDEISQRVLEAAKIVGLSEELLKKSPFDLSGGEKRRAALAGVLAMKPEVLVLDEPTAGLDPYGRDMILDQICEYRKQTGATVLLVSHSMEDVARVAEKVLVMNGGRVEMFDTVEKVFSRGDELSKIGLNVPHITQIFMKLKAKGVKVSEGVFTMDKAVNELIALFEKEGKNA
ncbi:MAG: energy-coupling factor transporter ATPase [Clostridia bacterium]|nr:energy-coupling factor transporter ATPase [Clostridia bacterium]